jgi:predicted ArsR family transcriptional regulator
MTSLGMYLSHNPTGVFLLTDGRSGHTHSVLSEAVYTYMNSIGEDYHEDVMRTLFRNRAGDIGQLLPHVMEIVRRSSHERGRNFSAVLSEANNIVLVSFYVMMLYNQL